MDGDIMPLTEIELEYMNIPPIHWRATLSQVPPDCPHKAIVQNYMENIARLVRQPLGLLLWGDYGTGKSALASICLKAARANGSGMGFFATAGDIAKHLIDDTEFSIASTTYREREENAPLLVLDEMKFRAQIGEKEGYVEDLLRLRQNAGLATIVTSNHAPLEIENRYPAMYSVLTEVLYPVEVSGHNFREGRAMRNEHLLLGPRQS
jgi:DNA replication protein DnaC